MPGKNNAACQALMKREGLKNEAELQSWFTRRMEKMVSARTGKTLIGWSEIMNGGIAQNAVVMDWIGGATEAARAGHDVVMSPPSHYAYFDFYQSTNKAVEFFPMAAGAELGRAAAFEQSLFLRAGAVRFGAGIAGAHSRRTGQFMVGKNSQS